VPNEWLEEFARAGAEKLSVGGASSVHGTASLRKRCISDVRISSLGGRVVRRRSGGDSINRAVTKPGTLQYDPGEVTLRHGRRAETLHTEEVDLATAAPVLQRYVRNVRVIAPFFDAKGDDPVERFIEEAPRHPVFKLIATSPWLHLTAGLTTA
jgi:hypothetical protein